MESEKFVEVFNQNQFFFKRFAMKLTKSSTDADDLIQDACVRAFCHIDGFKDTGKFKSWFCSILYNTFINKYRKKSRRSALLNSQLHTHGLFFTCRTTSNDGYEDLKFEDVFKLMAHIGHHNVEAFRLYEAGYTYQEISEMQGVPLGTVKSRIFFVRKKMRSMVAYQREQAA